MISYNLSNIKIKHELNKSILGNFNIIYIDINSLRNKIDEAELLINSYERTRHTRTKIENCNSLNVPNNVYFNYLHETLNGKRMIIIGDMNIKT